MGELFWEEMRRQNQSRSPVAKRRAVPGARAAGGCSGSWQRRRDGAQLWPERPCVVDVTAVRGAGGRHVPILQEQSPHATPSVVSAAQASVLLLLRGLLVRLLVRFGLFGGALLRGGGQEG